MNRYHQSFKFEVLCCHSSINFTKKYMTSTNFINIDQEILIKKV